MKKIKIKSTTNKQTKMNSASQTTSKATTANDSQKSFDYYQVKNKTKNNKTQTTKQQQ